MKMGVKCRVLSSWSAVLMLSVGSLAGAIGDLAKAAKARENETVGGRFDSAAMGDPLG